MNSPLLRWLLDLDTLPADAAQVQLGWERSMPGWLWVMLVIAVVGFCIYSYSRLKGATGPRVALASVRGLLILLLIVLLAGPMLVQPREQIERDWVLMLIDRSASMTIEDGALDSTSSGRRVSRDAQLQAALIKAQPVLDELSRERTVVWLGFDGGVFDLVGTGLEPSAASPDRASDRSETTTAPRPITLPTPDGWRTRLGVSVEEALQRAAARPLAGIVLFTDGRTVDPPSRAVIRRLQSEAAQVFVVPMGSDEPLGDLAVRRIESPQKAFVRDVVPVTVEIDRLGESARGMEAVVRLIDTATGVELDRADVPLGEESATITLTGRSEVAGDAAWMVVVETTREDLVADNNRREVAVGLVDRPLRVLYVEGYPRWEYRYLKNLLVREKSIEGSAMLLSADRDFAQEGSVSLARLPRTAEEFAPFDLVVIGDVPASFFLPEQLEFIRENVATRGMGLLWIGGPQATPSGWSGTALADLLPMRPPLELTAIGTPVNMVAAPLAERLGVLQLQTGPDTSGWPAELADPSNIWARLQWAQRIEPSQLKPTAEVLAETVQDLSGGPLPLVISMRYGAGQVLYVATDEVWRWRYGRGELLPEQFWVQMLRFLGRERVAGSDVAVSLEVEPRRVAPGEPARVRLNALDAALATLELASVAAVIETESGERLADLELKPTGRGGEYAATFIASDSASEDVGVRRIRVIDQALPEAAGALARIEVIRPDEERRRPETDHALLRSLAEETGGKVLSPDDLGPINTLPNRRIRTPDPITERIWNTPLALILILVLTTTEWIGRRLMKLL